MTMDYKYIEQLMERYFNAETSLEEESILRTFFSQENIPTEMQQWRALFTADDSEQLGDDFDARILAMIESEEASTVETKVVKAQEIKLTQRMMPLFKAAAVVAIILTLGGALQAPWDKSWNAPVNDYTSFKVDSVDAATPIQAENIIDNAVDSSKVLIPSHSKD